jgi:hypothetical protein
MRKWTAQNSLSCASLCTISSWGGWLLQYSDWATDCTVPHSALSAAGVVGSFSTATGLRTVQCLIVHYQQLGWLAPSVQRLGYGLYNRAFLWFGSRQGKEIFLFSRASRMALTPRSLLVSGCLGRNFQGVPRPGLAAHYSSTCSAGFMNEWSYTTIPSCFLVV